MQNAVIYARYSSHGQNEQTIEGQIRVCTEYAHAHGMNVIEVYTDKHKSGTTDDRPAFQRMVSDSASGRFQYVIVYMLERFNRNLYNSTIYSFQLAQNGVKVISATENISDSPEGDFYRMFLEWQAEQYSKSLSKRVKEGLTTSVERGMFGGGHLIYGYKVVGADGLDLSAGKKVSRRVVIDEDAASVVKYVFERYAKGASKKEIADELNEQGRRNAGKPYVGRDFDRMLTNRKYTGSFEFGGRICENMYPQIITPSLFEQVQERLKQNKYFSGANSARTVYLLQGKVFCGHCGEAMVAGGGTSKTGVRYHYYACNGHTKLHICHKRNEPKASLEQFVTEQAMIYLSNEKYVERIAHDVVEYHQNRTDQQEIRRLRAERTKTQKEIDNAVDLLISGVSAQTIKTLDAKITYLSCLMDDLTAQQERLEAEQRLKITETDIKAFIRRYISGDSEDKDFQKRIIDNLINAVYIYDDRIVVYFNAFGDHEERPSKADTDDVSFCDECDDDAKGVQTLSRSLRHQPLKFSGAFISHFQ